MISRELIEKINALWHKQKSVGLTDKEKEEQHLVREQYLEAIRGQVRGMLESIRNTDSQANEEHTGDCSCKHCKH